MNANKMKATDLAGYLEDYSVIKEGPFSQIIGKKSAKMLRKQDAAIKQLREALEFADAHIPGVGSVSYAIRAALEATEEFGNDAS